MIPSDHPRIFLAYLAVLAAAPLPLGSNRDWAWPVLCAVIFLLTAQLSLRPQAPMGGGARQLTLLGGLALWMLVQCSGLPFLFDGLALEAAPARNGFLQTLGYGAFAYLTIQLVRTVRSAGWVIGVLVVGATVQVALALYQLVVQSMASESGLGLGYFRASGTYASPNHLAGHLHQVLGLALGLLLVGYARHASAPWRAQVVAFVIGPGLRLRLLVVVLAAGLVMTLSRGGNIAFAAALGLATLVASLAVRRIRAPLLALVVSVLLVDVAVIGQHYGLERLRERVGGTTLENEFRDDLFAQHAAMLRDHGALGVGAGNYAVLVPRYRNAAVPGRLTHAENDYAQFAIELGVPGCLCLALFLAGALRQQWRMLCRTSDPERQVVGFGCLVATLAMLFHGFVDFNLRIPANALLFVLALTIPFGLEPAGGPADRGSA